MAPKSFSRVGVCCSHLEVSTAFCRDVLGLTELFSGSRRPRPVTVSGGR